VRRTGSWTPAFDYLLALLGIFLILAIVEKPTPTPMRIDTLGVYAVTASWPAGSNDDVDLWVQDPQGNIAWFAGQDAGLMHLESDDLGTNISGTVTLLNGKVISTKANGERTVIKGAIPGEYTVNIHMYQKNDPGTTVVTVQLWELRGQDRLLITKRIVLVRVAQEETAFRFTLDAAGNASNFNTLPKKLVGQEK
jgi:hypothetical protein